MRVTIDILDDRLEAIWAADDRERLRAYLDLWRGGELDPLGDAGVVVIVGFGGDEAGGRPLLPPLVANDGEGEAVSGGRRPPAAHAPAPPSPRPPPGSASVGRSAPPR